jgi:hypothetical protein
VIRVPATVIRFSSERAILARACCRLPTILSVVLATSFATSGCNILDSISKTLGGADDAGRAPASTPTPGATTSLPAPGPTPTTLAASWQKSGPFVTLHLGIFMCSQGYVCAPDVPGVYSQDCVRTCTPWTATKLPCTQDGVDMDSCSDCLAPPPSGPCSCTLVCPVH